MRQKIKHAKFNYSLIHIRIIKDLIVFLMTLVGVINYRKLQISTNLTKLVQQLIFNAFDIFKAYVHTQLWERFP